MTTNINYVKCKILNWELKLDTKYTVKYYRDGSLVAERYGMIWRDCCGDNLIYNLAAEVKNLREQLEQLKGGAVK